MDNEINEFMGIDPREAFISSGNDSFEASELAPVIQLQEYTCGGVCGRKIYAVEPETRTTSFGSTYRPLVLCESCQKVGREAINVIANSLRGGIRRG